MIRDCAQDLVNYLNGLLFVDQQWVQLMVEARPRCNNALANHPTLQVANMNGGVFRAGLLGLLNGFCGAVEDGPRKGCGAIEACFDDVGKLISFRLNQE